MPDMRQDSDATRDLLDAVGRGEPSALEKLLERHRPELNGFIHAHFDPRLKARIDPSDVVQEPQGEVVRSMDDFLASRPMPFHVWLRRKAMDRLRNLRRDHVKRARRSVSREQALPDRSSLLVARPLLARGSSPSSVHRRSMVRPRSSSVAVKPARPRAATRRLPRRRRAAWGPDG